MNPYQYQISDAYQEGKHYRKSLENKVKGYIYNMERGTISSITIPIFSTIEEAEAFGRGYRGEEQ